MDRDFLTDLFAPFGAIDMRRMFGGFSLSAGGVTFALVLRDQVYLKADEQTRGQFEAEGCAPFQYQARGRPVTLTSYWRMPERLYDDPDETAEWARAALGVARRMAAAKAAHPKKAKAKKATLATPKAKKATLKAKAR